jgi:hypothetical protein
MNQLMQLTRLQPTDAPGHRALATPLYQLRLPNRSAPAHQEHDEHWKAEACSHPQSQPT